MQSSLIRCKIVSSRAIDLVTPVAPVSFALIRSKVIRLAELYATYIASQCCGNCSQVLDETMDSNTDQPVDAGVRFAPRLTEDSLPVTLPKDAEKSAEAPSASPEAPLSFEPQDKPVSAGVLDLQLVPQVCSVDLRTDHR